MPSRQTAKKKSKPKPKAKARGKKENAVVRYWRETRLELRKVHWPTRREAWSLTKIVLIVTISMAAFLGMLDYLFTLELNGIVDGSPVAIAVVVVVAVAAMAIALVSGRQTAR